MKTAILNALFIALPLISMDQSPDDWEAAARLSSLLASGSYDIFSKVNNITYFEIAEKIKEQYPLTFGVFESERDRQDHVAAKYFARAILLKVEPKTADGRSIFAEAPKVKHLMPLVYRVYQEAMTRQRIETLLRTEFRKRFLEHEQFYYTSHTDYQNLIDQINQRSSIILNKVFRRHIFLNNRDSLVELDKKAGEFNEFIKQQTTEEFMMANLFLRTIADGEDFNVL